MAKSNACHCYSFVGQEIIIIIILINQNKILENQKIVQRKIFHRKLVNSRPLTALRKIVVGFLKKF